MTSHSYDVIVAGVGAMGSAACVYTVSPDEDFITDRVPQAVFASACSGHGFKFASAIGEILANLSTTGHSAFDLAPFSLSRFAQA